MNELLLILVLQLVYVPLYTLSMLFMVKGYKHISSMVSFFEVLVNIYGLSIVFTGQKTFVSMIVYALGSALGMEIGAFIEGKIALGYLCVEVLIKEKDENLINELTRKGFGVTMYSGKWKLEGGMCKIDVLSKRNREYEVEEIILNHQPEAFIVMYEPYDIKGNQNRTGKKNFFKF